MIKSVVFLVYNLWLKYKKISLMYSLLNVGRLYLVLGFISVCINYGLFKYSR